MNKLKKSFAFLLVLVILLTTVPLTAFAAEKGACGPNATYSLSSSGVLTISGKGATYNQPIFVSERMREEIYIVKIKSGITKIGNNLLKECDYLESVTIPSTVTSIGSQAFEECESLTSVSIPTSVKTIGTSAFEDCENLTFVKLVNGLTKIGDHAFAGNSCLSSVTIPKTVQTIGRRAFEDCEGLENVTIQSGVKTIGAYAFYDCEWLDTVTIPKSVISIGSHAFDSDDYNYNKTIKGYAGSAAEDYAHQEGFHFKAIGNTSSSSSSSGSASLATPKLTSVTNVDDGVKIVWKKVAGAAKYRVFYKTSSGGWRKLKDTTSTSYVWKKARNNTTYSFTVRCINKSGSKYTSNYNSKGLSIKYLDAPDIENLRVTGSGIRITWDRVPGAAAYRVFYRTGSGNWKKLKDTTSTRYTWTAAKKGRTYQFTVRCINRNGTSYTSAYDDIERIRY